MGILAFAIILSWCQSDHINDENQIDQIIQQDINICKDVVSQKIDKLLLDPSFRSSPASEESIKGLSYFIMHNDSLILWDGEHIVKTKEKAWLYDTKNQVLHHHFIKGPFNAYLSIKTKYIAKSGFETPNSSKQISSLVIPKSKFQLFGFSILLILLTIIIGLWNAQQAQDKKSRAFLAGSFFVFASLCILASFNESIVNLPLIVRSLLWFLSGTFFLAGSMHIPNYTKPTKRHSFSFSILTGSLIAGFNILSQSYLNLHEELDFQKINFYSPDQFLFAVGGILILFGIWIIFKHAFSGEREKLSNKIYKCLLLVSSYLIIAYFGFVELPFPLVILFLIVYYLTADLFFEIKEQSATWLIWWIILNASFFASNLYFISIQKEIGQSLESLKTFYKEVDINQLEEQQNIIATIDTTVFFENIKSLPDNAKLSNSDIKAYLKELGVPSIKDSEIFYFHQNGDSGLLGRDINKTQFSTYISIYKDITPNIKFDHLSGRYLTQFDQLEDFYILSKGDESDPTFDFGVFKSQEFIYGNVDYIPEFITHFPGKEIVFTRNAVTHLAFRPESDLIIYSNKTYDSLLKPISIFSLIFCIAIFTLFLISLLNNRFGNNSNLPLFFRQNKTLRLRIQIIIIFLILLSFVSIALITSLYFKNILRNSGEKEITSKVVALNNSLQNTLRKVYDTQTAHNIIENEIPKLSKIHNIELNFYNNSGRGSTNELDVLPYYPFYTFNIEADMSPITRFNEEGEVQAFFPITTINQGTLGFLSLKNANKTGKHVEPLSDFLGTILNLYVFLFLIAGAIAIAVSRSITKPLSTLSEKFNSIKVGQKNEIINWESDDEIGSLIANYNDMVQKLDLNIELLAKTERDSAWQEMAKQVAHEIKNPLTPMKLGLQYLQSAIGRHPERAEELIKRTSHTLLEQIDNLTEIANAFSNLASLPQADNDKIVLNEVVEAVHDLFRKRDDIDIQLAEPLEEIVVFADKGHLVRILNNIVKNAIQSIPQDKAGKIDIRLYKAQNNAIISVTDNGDGIPLNLRSKIFTPKFTTKSSGSGLGLAIAKNMIESFNGHIYFDTTVGKGTTFFIEIPLMRNPLLKEGIERVEL